jgi:hypothetical protein
MDSYEVIGRVEAGRLQIDREALRRALAGWEGKTVRVTVKRERGSRSDRQLRYLWGVCYAMLAEETTHEDWEIHEVAKGLFLPKALALAGKNGEVVGQFVIGGSTGRLNTKEMGAFIDKVRAWGLDFFNVHIPPPNEPW